MRSYAKIYTSKDINALNIEGIFNEIRIYQRLNKVNSGSNKYFGTLFERKSIYIVFNYCIYYNSLENRISNMNILGYMFTQSKLIIVLWNLLTLLKNIFENNLPIKYITPYHLYFEYAPIAIAEFEDCVIKCCSYDESRIKEWINLVQKANLKDEGASISNEHEKSYVYQFGLIAYILISVNPISNYSTQSAFKTLDTYVMLSDDLRNFLKSTLNEDQCLRPTLNEAILLYQEISNTIGIQLQ